MGQVVRQRKYNEFWKAMSSGIFRSESYEDRVKEAVNLLLTILSDVQLDEMLADIADSSKSPLVEQAIVAAMRCEQGGDE